MAHFWKSFQKAMGTQLTMSTTFHPQADGPSKKTIQVLEDMSSRKPETFDFTNSSLES